MGLETLVVVMAGGEGSRLWPLTGDVRAKPAVPFAGKYRLIDIPLSNALNSDLHNVIVLTQGRNESFNQHVTEAWPSHRRTGSFVRVIPPQVLGETYEGDADAVRQIRRNIQSLNPKNVLVLPADHVVKMNYAIFVADMVAKGADATISLVPNPIELLGDLGAVKIDEKTGRILEMAEKEKDCLFRVPGNPEAFYASMGIYAFRKDAILHALDYQGDLFGKHIIPPTIKDMKVVGYDFLANNNIPEIRREKKGMYFETEETTRSGDSGYWRDVGKIGPFFEANMDLIAISPAFNLYNELWQFFTLPLDLGPAKVINSNANQLSLSAGNIVSDMTGKSIVLSPGVEVYASNLNEVVIFNNSRIQKCDLRRTIVDKSVELRGMQIGYDDEADRARGIYIDKESGIRVIPKGYRLGDTSNWITPEKIPAKLR